MTTQHTDLEKLRGRCIRPADAILQLCQQMEDVVHAHPNYAVMKHMMCVNQNGDPIVTTPRDPNPRSKA